MGPHGRWNKHGSEGPPPPPNRSASLLFNTFEFHVKIFVCILQECHYFKEKKEIQVKNSCSRKCSGHTPLLVGPCICPTSAHWVLGPRLFPVRPGDVWTEGSSRELGPTGEGPPPHPRHLAPQGPAQPSARAPPPSLRVHELDAFISPPGLEGPLKFSLHREGLGFGHRSPRAKG